MESVSRERDERAGFLKRRAEQGMLRALKPSDLRKDGKIFFGNREYVDFSSNDYLGLSFHPRILKESKKALERFGSASSASRLMSGDLSLHHQLESRIARFKNKEAALFFNSGFQANTGIIAALYGRGDCVFSDRLNHASIIDGITLSGAELFRFRHNDVEHLENLLKKERAKFKQALIITETIFSMDGDKAPLKELARLKEEYSCSIMVDEAHATGIFGKDGSGIVEEEGLTGEIDFIMGTFSKALAGFGAYLAASKIMVEYLINTCRSFIYSTALPPVIIAGNIASLDLIKEEPRRRVELLRNARYLREALLEKGFKVSGSSQIIPIIIGGVKESVDLADKLREKGYWVTAVRPPTVPKGRARLRLSLSYHHDLRTIHKFIDDLAKTRV